MSTWKIEKVVLPYLEDPPFGLDPAADRALRLNVRTVVQVMLVWTGSAWPTPADVMEVVSEARRKYPLPVESFRLYRTGLAVGSVAFGVEVVS